MDKTLMGVLAGLLLFTVAATGYNYYRIDQLNERVLLDHAKLESIKPAEVKPVKPNGSVGALP